MTKSSLNNTLFHNNCQIYMDFWQLFSKRFLREGRWNGRGPGGPGSIGGSLAGTGAPLYPHPIACANYCKIPVFSRKLKYAFFRAPAITIWSHISTPHILAAIARMTAHITIRGRNKFATPPSVLCNVLLFLERIINQRVEGHNIFHNLFVPWAKRKEWQKLWQKKLCPLRNRS